MSTDAAKTTIDVDPEEFMLVHDVASICCAKNVDLTHYYTISAGVVPITDVHTTDVCGHRVVRNEPHTIVAPFILNLNDGMQYCCAGFRHLNDVSSYWAIPLDKVRSFVKARDSKSFKEELYYQAIKCNLPSVVSVTPLEKDDALRDNFLEILKLSSIFKEVNLTSITAFDKWANTASYATIVTKVVDQLEKRERQNAQGQGNSSNDRDVSRDGGKEAMDQCAKIKAALLLYEPFYQQGFASRFIVMETKDSLAACLDALKNDPLLAMLKPALEQLAVKDFADLAVPTGTPLKKLLEPPPAKPAAPVEPVPEPPPSAAVRP